MDKTVITEELIAYMVSTGKNMEEAKEDIESGKNK